MVESNGYKLGIVKFIGTTEFAPGEWVGVALDKAHGKMIQRLLKCYLIALLAFPPSNRET